MHLAALLAVLTLAVPTILQAERNFLRASGCSASPSPLNVRSSNANSEFRKAQEAFDENRIDQAVSYLLKGIRLEPDNIEAYNDLGAIYFHTNAPEKAIEAFTKMVVLDPRCFRGYVNLAFTFFSQQRYSEAEFSARRAVDLRKSDARARYLLGASLALQKKHLLEAEENLAAAAPEMVEARYQLSRLLIDKGELERGMRELQLFTIESQRRGSSKP